MDMLFFMFVGWRWVMKYILYVLLLCVDYIRDVVFEGFKLNRFLFEMVNVMFESMGDEWFIVNVSVGLVFYGVVVGWDD